MSNNKIKNLISTFKNNKKLLISIALLTLFLLLTIGTTGIVRYVIERKEAEELPEISYETLKVIKGGNAQVLVTFANVNGIDTITDFTSNTIYANGRMKIAVDYKLKDRQTYQFTLKDKRGTSKQLTLNYEIPRKNGNYLIDNGIYVNSPDLTGFDQRYTRYLYMNNNKMVVGTWINKQTPSNWFSYKNNNWANIYVECGGLESYYVWVPRYCYKLDESNQRVDVKFISVYDEYMDGTTGEITEWDALEAQGYIIPEAFYWEAIAIPGYWVSKYQLSDLTSYKVDFTATATTSINIRDITTNLTGTIAKYEYAINGEVVYEGATPNNYKKSNIESAEYIVTVTAKDSYGQVLGSMTKRCETVNVNPPDLTGFDRQTTFYVYWDENGNEHNEIPITEDPPSNWYDYAEQSWANIVTRNNGTESYFVWVPRYQYQLNSTTQRVDVRFIDGTSTSAAGGYTIPEAFTWGEGSTTKQLTGYWVNKYQLSEQTTIPALDADIAIGDNCAKVGSIRGTAVTNYSGNVKFEYYVNATKVHEGTNANEYYLFENLQEHTTYGLTIIARHKTTNAFLGATTKKLTTIVINKPDLTGFNKNITYYVTGFDSNGNAIVGSKIENDGSNKPNNWYNYTNRQWANIVVTDGTVSNGTITGGTYKNYFVWVPRYQYMLDTVNQRVDVRFIEGTSTSTANGYTIPEAFTWGESGTTRQLTGYWVSKYQLSE